MFYGMTRGEGDCPRQTDNILWGHFSLDYSQVGLAKLIMFFGGDFLDHCKAGLGKRGEVAITILSD